MPLCLATHLSASDSFTTMALYKSIYLLTYKTNLLSIWLYKRVKFVAGEHKDKVVNFVRRRSSGRSGLRALYYIIVEQEQRSRDSCVTIPSQNTVRCELNAPGLSLQFDDRTRCSACACSAPYFLSVNSIATPRCQRLINEL